MGHYQKALALNPNSPRSASARTGLGIILERMGKPSEAQACYRQSLELDWNSSAVWACSKAILAFEQALSLNPNLEQAHYFLGEVYDEIGQGQKTIFHIRWAEKVSGQNLNWALQNKARGKLNVLSEKYSTAP